MPRRTISRFSLRAMCLFLGTIAASSINSFGADKQPTSRPTSQPTSGPYIPPELRKLLDQYDRSTEAGRILRRATDPNAGESVTDKINRLEAENIALRAQNRDLLDDAVNLADGVNQVANHTLTPERAAQLRKAMEKTADRAQKLAAEQAEEIARMEDALVDSQVANGDLRIDTSSSVATFTETQWNVLTTSDKRAKIQLISRYLKRKGKSGKTTLRASDSDKLLASYSAETGVVLP